MGKIINKTCQRTCRECTFVPVPYYIAINILPLLTKNNVEIGLLFCLIKYCQISHIQKPMISTTNIQSNLGGYDV